MGDLLDRDTDGFVDRFNLQDLSKKEPTRSAALKPVAKTEIGFRAPELVMIHCAHTAGVCSVKWGQGEEGSLLASLDTTGVLHLWQPSTELTSKSTKLPNSLPGMPYLWGPPQDIDRLTTMRQ